MPNSDACISQETSQNLFWDYQFLKQFSLTNVYVVHIQQIKPFLEELGVGGKAVIPRPFKNRPFLLFKIVLEALCTERIISSAYLSNWSVISHY